MSTYAHADPHKMRRDELEACGCQRCQDALRMMDKLDELIASSLETDHALARLEQTVSNLEGTV